jgi:three-Cys-motif partner protein
MNNFGGQWTVEKMDIFLKYVPAYLQIMHSTITKRKFAKDWKLMYFDGFAGSGAVMEDGDESDFLEGVATRVLNVSHPRTFDMYYFVEFIKDNAKELKSILDQQYTNRNTHVVQEDFNTKIKDLANYLQDKGKNYKVLAFIDPFGMNVKWESIQALQGLSVDMWILVPTGLGNRLLKRNMEIPDTWFSKLEDFLGISRDDIKSIFYKEKQIHTLFGEETEIQKTDNAIQKVADLYTQQLNKVFKHVSNAYPLRNSQNTILYHFLLASNNKAAQNIANDIINKLIQKR